MCEAHKFAPVPKKTVSFPAWLTLPQNNYIWQGKNPGEKRQTSSGLGGCGSVKHANTCLPLSTWIAPLTSLEKQACSCQGLQEDCVLMSSCRLPFQLLFFFFPPPFVEKDAKQECACRVGELRWLRATKHQCVTQTLKKHTHRCFWRGNQQHSDSCPQA